MPNEFDVVSMVAGFDAVDADRIPVGGVASSAAEIVKLKSDRSMDRRDPLTGKSRASESWYSWRSCTDTGHC